MLEEILNRRVIEKALEQVESNKGAGGVDGMKWDELRPYINNSWQSLRGSILEESYAPSAVRKVEIDKTGGGKRMLGIPTVKDRLIQQAIAQWLTPRYEPKFSNRSYGYRPGKNAHQAVLQAKQYLIEGKRWVIELDLAQFFDRVDHDKLMGKLRKEITDSKTLRLIRKYLTCGIMEGGLISPRNEGTAQGSPLSPILSNIVLDDLDKELERRGHAFVRFADDVNIYVASETSAKRVMENLIIFIEEKLKLKVNREKTKVLRYSQSSLLGFGFHTPRWGVWNIRVSKKSIDRVKAKCKEITQRSNGMSEEERITRLSSLIKGWVNYIRIAKSVKGNLQKLDAYVRNRLRICQWKQWKRFSARVKNLQKLGIKGVVAYNCARSSKGYARLAVTKWVNLALSVGYYQKKGYIGFYDTYYEKTGRQTLLF